MPSVTQVPSKETANNPLFDQISNYEHEQVAFCYDKASGLKSIIAIHSTILGPALGGTRFWNYNSDADAITDVLRLSRGMTFKASLAGLNLGGGKAVIIGDAKTDKSEALFRRYGRFVEGLNGRYITAEDVGTATSDMEFISNETKHVTGIPEYMGGSGDPSPFTAYGTFLGIKASVNKRYGNDSLDGKKVAVQGVGHVGGYLVKHLVDAGAKVIITDISTERIKELVALYPGKVTGVEPDDIYDVDMDIYSPCALGATVNDQTIDRLKCSIISGASNNQLADEKKHGQQLIEKGILYAPDFLINAGGLINVGCELEGYNRQRVNADVEKIYQRTLDIYKMAADENIPTQQAATKMAEKRLKAIATLNSRL